MHINVRKSFKNDDHLRPYGEIFIEADNLKHKVKVEKLDVENIYLRPSLILMSNFL